jgi:hypothetical protein
MTHRRPGAARPTSADQESGRRVACCMTLLARAPPREPNSVVAQCGVKIVQGAAAGCPDGSRARRHPDVVRAADGRTARSHTSER